MENELESVTSLGPGFL